MTDPNEDLIGVSIPADTGELVVTGSAPWNSAYVECEPTSLAGAPTVRVAAQLRNALLLERS